MELHRVPEVPSDFPHELFNKIYKELKPLKRSLVRGIDSRRYGVTPDIISSWFDDKIMFVFLKYYKDRDDKHLKNSIIQALGLFKNRVLRKAYGGEADIYSNIINIIDEDTGDDEIFNIIPIEDEIDESKLFVELITEFMRNNLSQEAYEIFELQLNPPEFIKSRAKSLNNITSKLIAQYYELPINRINLSRIENCKLEIQNVITQAREYFNSPSYI